MGNQENAIKIITEALAKMTSRAIEAERRLEVATKDADDWRQNWQAKYKQCEELEQKIQQLIEKYQGGAQNHGKVK